MKEDLIKLRNTLALISTKGDDTLIMADCLRFCESLIRQEEAMLLNEQHQMKPEESERG